MEQQYQRCVYHLCTLILDKKYLRTISIINYIFQQGIKTHQLLLLLSYAQRMVDGPQKALITLSQSKMEGPLIQFAKAQFNEQLGLFSHVPQHLANILKMEKQGLLGEIYKSLNFFEEDDKKPPFYEQNHHKDFYLINRANEITEKLKKGFIKSYQAKEGFEELLQKVTDPTLKKLITKNIKCCHD